MPRAAGSNVHLCSPSLRELISQGSHSPHKTGMNHGNNQKLAPRPIIQTLCAHSTPKDTLFTVLFAWHGHCLIEASRLTYVARRNMKYTHMHAHTHAHAHTPIYEHRGTQISQELIWTSARAGNGGSRKEITVAASRVLCAGRPWLLC